MRTTTVHDKNSYVLPTVEELRDSQAEGEKPEGLLVNDAKLNEAQGHEVDIKE